MSHIHFAFYLDVAEIKRSEVQKSKILVPRFRSERNYLPACYGSSSCIFLRPFVSAACQDFAVRCHPVLSRARAHIHMPCQLDTTWVRVSC